MDKIIAKSISNIYNTAKQRISSNLQWAGQQAQQYIGRPTQQTIQNAGNRISSNLNLVAKPIQNQVKHDIGQLSYFQQQEKQNKLQPSTLLSATTPVGQIGRALRTDYDTQINKVLSGNFTSNPTLNRVTSNIGLVAKPVINTALDFVAPKFTPEESALIKKIRVRQKLTPQEAQLADSMATKNTLNIGLSMSGVKSIDKPAPKALAQNISDDLRYNLLNENNTIENTQPRIQGEVGKDWSTYRVGETPISPRSRDATKIGYKDIRGQSATKPEEVGSLLKDYRNPRSEYLHLVYVKDGKVVAHNATNYDVVNATRISQRDVIYGIGDRLKRLNADGFYVAHNHPSGEVTPSGVDLIFTDRLRKIYKDKLMGSVVLDHDKLANITNPVHPNNTTHLPYDVHDIDLGKSYKIDAPTISNKNTLMQIAETHWDKNSGKTGVFITNIKGQPVAYEAINFNGKKPEKINETLRQLVRKNAGQNVFLIDRSDSWIANYKVSNNLTATDILIHDTNNTVNPTYHSVRNIKNSDVPGNFNLYKRLENQRDYAKPQYLFENGNEYNATNKKLPKTNLLKQPRSEKVAIEMLKKGEITTQQYNEIAGREGFRAHPTLQEQQATKELENLLGGNPKASITNRLREEGSQLRQKGKVVAPYSGVDSNISGDKIPIRTPDQVSGELLPPQTQSQVKVANMNTESLSKKLEVARYKRAQGAGTSQINLPSIEDIVSAPGNNVKNKVNALDYLRTPDRVLQKIGLGKQAETIKQSYNNYLDELPKEINKVTQWYERVGKSKESSQKIFQYLDGKPVTLIGEEVPVANEIKQYLKQWADKLNLPDDKRIASYITHIFEKDFIQKEFDPDLAKIIQDKVPGSVYDPFLQERLGKQGYIEDAFRALDAYVKRATRKYNMDPALEKLSSASENLDIDSWNYVKQYADRINLRPTQLDNLVDNLVKSTPVGYKLGQRPVANVTRKLRQQVYRGTLGLNVGSAIRNLTQGVNTYAQLGEKYTATGYLKAIKAMITGSQELENVGVLRNSFIEDRGISATKKLWEKIDKGLFTFFEIAEKINRGSAYYGAKSKALAQGMSEQDAVKAGLDLARKTQFTFGSVDTPVALQSDIAKFATQFQSFNIKQTEFLAEMFKSKQYSGLIRWLGANAVILLTLGKVMGWDWKDMVPFGGVLEGQTPIGGSPVFTLGRDIGALSTGGKDKYGQDMKPAQVATDLIPFIPGGVQVLNKTIPGVYDVNQGFATSGYGFEKLSDIATGNKRRIKYPIAQTPQNYIQAALLGGSNLPEARQYKESNSSVLGEKQSQSVRDSADKIGTYNKIMTKRATDKQIDKAKEQAKITNKTQTVGNVYVIPQPDGTTKTVDMAKQIPKPDLSGSLDMDKMEVSKFKSAITRQASDIQELYKAGQIDLQTAITKIADLKSQTAQLPTFTVKKPKQITSIKVKKAPSIKIKRPKRLKYKKPKKLKIKGLTPMKWKTVKLKRP